MLRSLHGVMGQIWVVRFTIRHGTRIFQPCAHLCNTPLCKREVGRVMHIFHELATFRDTAEYGPSANVSARPSPAARKATLFFTTSQSRLAERSGMKIERRSSPCTNGCETVSSRLPLSSQTRQESPFVQSWLLKEISIDQTCISKSR